MAAILVYLQQRNISKSLSIAWYTNMAALGLSEILYNVATFKHQVVKNVADIKSV